MSDRVAGNVRILALAAQWTGLAVAATYLVNALTRQDARVTVAQDVDAGTAAVGAGQFTPHHTVGVFYVQGLSGSDRVVSRLGVIVFWLLVAVIGHAVQRQARRSASTGPAWLITRSRYTTTLAVALTGLGVVPPLGQALAASAVLQAAGSPAGYSPPVTLELGWIVAGVGYAVVVAVASSVRARGVRVGRQVAGVRGAPPG